MHGRVFVMLAPILITNYFVQFINARHANKVRQALNKLTTKTKVASIPQEHQKVHVHIRNAFLVKTLVKMGCIEYNSYHQMSQSALFFIYNPFY